MDDSWKNRAACAGVDVNEFYDRAEEKGRSVHIKSIQERYCNRCPVKYECLIAGADEPYGIWGGQTQNERKRTFRISA